MYVHKIDGDNVTDGRGCGMAVSDAALFLSSCALCNRTSCSLDSHQESLPFASFI